MDPACAEHPGAPVQLLGRPLRPVPRPRATTSTPCPPPTRGPHKPRLATTHPAAGKRTAARRRDVGRPATYPTAGAAATEPPTPRPTTRSPTPRPTTPQPAAAAPRPSPARPEPGRSGSRWSGSPPATTARANRSSAAACWAAGWADVGATAGWAGAWAAAGRVADASYWASARAARRAAAAVRWRWATVARPDDLACSRTRRRSTRRRACRWLARSWWAVAWWEWGGPGWAAWD